MPRTTCFQAFREGRRMKKGTFFECPVCTKTFYRYPSQIVEGKPTTCSRTCAARYFRDKGETVECPVCSNPFYRPLSVATYGFGNFCSKPCWVSARKGFPVSAPWKPWQRTGWKEKKCERCDETRHLQLDHKTPTCLGGENERQNAQTLCRRCNVLKFHREDLPAFLKQKDC